MRRSELIITNRFLVEEIKDKCYNNSFLYYYQNVVKPDYQLNRTEVSKVFSCFQTLFIKALLQGIVINMKQFGSASIVNIFDQVECNGSFVYFMTFQRRTKRLYKTMWSLRLKALFNKALKNGDINSYEILKNRTDLQNGNMGEFLKRINDLSNITL